jgi:hypothetical protein
MDTEVEGDGMKFGAETNHNYNCNFCIEYSLQVNKLKHDDGTIPS